jgi:hypothetical protein
LQLQGVQVICQGKRITTQAPRFRDPKNGVWVPAVILPDELGAREVQSMLLRRPGKTLQQGSLSKVLSTPLDQLINDSITDT